MRKYKIYAILFVIYFIFTGIAFCAGFTAFSGKINAENINLRVDATVGSAVICTLLKGQLVEIVWQAHEWYKIRLPKEAPSYVKKNLVECINSDPVTNPGKCLSAKVIKDRINIRLEPGESAWILGKVNKLTVINILGQEGDWYKIAPVYQSYGWVHKKFIDKEINKGSVAPKKQEQVISAPVVENVLPSNQLVIQGTVSPYGIVLWRKATHKLVTSDNKIYFLKGNRKALDSLNYHKVKVTGKLISPAKSKQPIIEIDIIEVLN